MTSALVHVYICFALDGWIFPTSELILGLMRYERSRLSLHWQYKLNSHAAAALYLGTFDPVLKKKIDFFKIFCEEIFVKARVEDERKMEDAKAAVNGVEYDVESDDDEPREIVDVKVDDGDKDDEDEDDEEQDGSGDDEGEEEEDGSDDDEDEDSDEDDDEEAASEEEDLGTEYLIQPVGRAEDEEDASDFEPNNESEVDEDIEEEEEANDDDDVGRVEASSKRRRPSTDGAVRNGEDDDDDDERPSKR